MTRRSAKALLVVLAATGLWVGVWALVDPRGFFDGFPGGGRSWVAADGPYNEHLVRDVGAFNVALGLLALWAFARPTRVMVVGTAIAWLAYGLPHAVYHATHLDVFSGADKTMVAVATAATPIVALALLIVPVRATEPVVTEPAPDGAARGG
jgi:hypothetical protein